MTSEYKDFVENNEVTQGVFNTKFNNKVVHIKRKLTDSIMAIYAMNGYGNSYDLPIINYGVDIKFECQTIVDLKDKKCIDIAYNPKKIDGYKKIKINEIIDKLCNDLDKKLYDYYYENFNKIQLTEVSNINFKNYFKDYVQEYVICDDISIYLDANKNRRKINLLKSISGCSEILLKNIECIDLCIDFLENCQQLEKRLFNYFISNDNEVKYVNKAIDAENHKYISIEKINNSKEYELNRKIYTSLKSIPDAKTVNMTIKVDEDILEFKYNNEQLKRDLLHSETTSDVAYNKVKDFLRTKRTYEDFGYKYDKIFFKDIIRITYGKKIIYSREGQ